MEPAVIGKMYSAKTAGAKVDAANGSNAAAKAEAASASKAASCSNAAAKAEAADATKAASDSNVAAQAEAASASKAAVANAQLREIIEAFMKEASRDRSGHTDQQDSDCSDLHLDSVKRE